MATPQKDPITCHVLDTTAGRPAANIAVRLEGPETTTAASPHRYTAVTDADGRVTRWQPDDPLAPLADALASVGSATSRWRLTFATEAYFGEGRTFFPEAVVVFRVQQGQHYHVPLLLSPFTFTTYRGS
ncbi:transthyretin domain protein [Cordyceps fumosorosea ARSEF 2679]|uniref:5-hydroxyisourate hydrolase n=1 Tax=Cordyceps fumosorosea (strain ARSEF 2679) TaxID=1081104 RepID=A0A162MSH1_CORFA|nr:transthyretin domain protein [Cordyceps fumosorosea ARSEF 2679]OAA69589.1 transthyretin domain protein [Cordyceps fumosorosea ARSEF 2679]